MTLAYGQSVGTQRMAAVRRAAVSPAAGTERMKNMKYYVLEGTFAEALPAQGELQKAIDDHLAYLQTGFDDGTS